MRWCLLACARAVRPTASCQTVWLWLCCGWPPASTLVGNFRGHASGWTARCGISSLQASTVEDTIDTELCCPREQRDYLFIFPCFRLSKGLQGYYCRQQDCGKGCIQCTRWDFLSMCTSPLYALALTASALFVVSSRAVFLGSATQPQVGATWTRAAGYSSYRCRNSCCLVFTIALSAQTYHRKASKNSPQHDGIWRCLD